MVRDPYHQGYPPSSRREREVAMGGVCQQNRERERERGSMLDYRRRGSAGEREMTLGQRERERVSAGHDPLLVVNIHKDGEERRRRERERERERGAERHTMRKPLTRDSSPRGTKQKSKVYIVNPELASSDSDLDTDQVYIKYLFLQLLLTMLLLLLL